MSNPDDAHLDALLGALPWPDRAPDDDTVEAVAAKTTLDEALEAQLAASAELRELWAQRDQPVSPMLLLRMEKAAPRRSRAPVYAGLAVAAALLLGVGWFFATRGPALPEYGLELAGTAKLTRSSDSAPRQAVFRPESRVRITLRPATRVDGPVRLAVFLVDGDALRRVDDRGRLEAEPGGVFVFSAPGRALFGDAPGRFVLYVALGADPAGLAGRPPEAVEADAARWHRVDVDYQTSKE